MQELQECFKDVQIDRENKRMVLVYFRLYNRPATCGLVLRFPNLDSGYRPSHLRLIGSNSNDIMIVGLFRNWGLKIDPFEEIRG